ncbi:hypothetical protein Efla_005465 [Eimeria flavescens]
MESPCHEIPLQQQLGGARQEPEQDQQRQLYKWREQRSLSRRQQHSQLHQHSPPNSQHQQPSGSRQQERRRQRNKQQRQQQQLANGLPAGVRNGFRSRRKERLPHSAGCWEAGAPVAAPETAYAAADDSAFGAWRLGAAPGAEECRDEEQQLNRPAIRAHGDGLSVIPGANPTNPTEADGCLPEGCAHGRGPATPPRRYMPPQCLLSAANYFYPAASGYLPHIWGHQGFYDPGITAGSAAARLLPMQPFYCELTGGQQQESALPLERAPEHVYQQLWVQAAPMGAPMPAHFFQQTPDYPYMSMVQLPQHFVGGYLLQPEQSVAAGRRGHQRHPQGVMRTNVACPALQQDHAADDVDSGAAGASVAYTRIGSCGGSGGATANSTEGGIPNVGAAAGVLAYGGGPATAKQFVPTHPHAYLEDGILQQLQRWPQQHSTCVQQQLPHSHEPHFQLQWHRWRHANSWHKELPDRQHVQHALPNSSNLAREFYPYHPQRQHVRQAQNSDAPHHRGQRGPQLVSGGRNWNHQRNAKRHPRLTAQHHMSQEHSGGATSPHREAQGPQEHGFAAAAASPGAAVDSGCELNAEDAAERLDATPLWPPTTPGACSPDSSAVLPHCIAPSAVHGTPSNNQQQLQSSDGGKNKPNWSKDKNHHRRPRSLLEERKLIASSQKQQKGPTLGMSSAKETINANATAAASSLGTTSSRSDECEGGAPAEVTIETPDSTSCSRPQGGSPSSDTGSSRTRRSQKHASNGCGNSPSSRMLPEEGYSYTKNMAYLAPLVERKKVGPEDFVLMQVIGKGSYGKVMLVKFEQDGQLYALKVLLKESLLRRSQVQHTRTERAVLEVISHPFIVQMHFAFQTPKKLYFVLEYCPGGELFFHLQRERKFTESRARFYAAELLLALEHLHRHNVIYRDLKPENVLLDAEGHVRLTDFGLSKSGIADNNSARSICGTPEYIAPEILCQVGHGKAADWWSLGALLYEMLTGLPPFYTSDRQTLFSNILGGGLEFPVHLSPVAVNLLRSLLHRDANERLGAGPTDAEEIKMHPFFRSVDWDQLLAKKVKPPYKPRLRSYEDSKYFPPELKKEPVISDNEDGPDSAFATVTSGGGSTRSQRSGTANPSSSSCNGRSATRAADAVAACSVASPSEVVAEESAASANTPDSKDGAIRANNTRAVAQTPDDDEGEGLFLGFTYDERFHGTWGKAAASTDDPFEF